MRHQRDRRATKARTRVFQAQAWGLITVCSAGWNLSRTSVPEQAQSIAQPLPQVWGAAQLPEVGGEVSTSTAISGHKSHKERFPATENQLCVVPIEVHLCTEG